jgi:hypothetical protein
MLKHVSLLCQASSKLEGLRFGRVFLSNASDIFEIVFYAKNQIKMYNGIAHFAQ